MEGYRNKGSCITHNSRAVKNSTNHFILHTWENKIPDLTGYVVFDYRTFGPLNFVTLPGLGKEEELETKFSD